MNEAIKLAKEHGYESPIPVAMVNDETKKHTQEWLLNVFMQDYFSPMVTSDPLFWQALGKALGWNGEHEWYYKGEQADPNYRYSFTHASCINCNQLDTIAGRKSNCEKGNNWLNQALWYHKVNLTGGDTEKFWKDLIQT